MAYHCTLQEKRTFPVTVGNHIFYVDQYQVIGIRQFTERTTVEGAAVFTNHAIRARRLHLEGRFLRTDPPAALLLELETYLAENKRFTVELDGIRYSMCQITRYVIQENGCSATVACQLECLVNQLQAVGG